MTEIQTKDIEELLEFFGKNTYRARESSATGDQILNKCLELWKLDYKCMVVPNVGGELCNSYPNKLIVPESEVVPEGLEPPEPCPLTLTSPSPLNLASPSFMPGGSAPSFSSVVSGGQLASISVNGHPVGSPSQRKGSLPVDGSKTEAPSAETQSNGARLRELILKAKFARCRARFPVPVILYKGNYISRSATLSGGPEMYGRSGLDYIFSSVASSKPEEEDLDDEVPQTNSDWQLFDKVRAQDIRLLKACNVGVIVDLMVEKKKVKFGMYVTSSEKVDKENRYNDFSIVSLPYPGCEFFKDFRDVGYSGEGLYFNWNQNFVDAQLVIPERTMSAKVAPDWGNYRRWDLVRLSQNYLKLLLNYTHESSQGLLIHCISGWDRTPLFISLLRLSLWADGLVHSSLDCAQILYLTIAYDWMAFGHDLQDRLNKGEEIFFFCFYFLKFITSDDFTIGRRRHISSDSASSDRLDGCVLLDADGLSSAGSSNSLNSSCSSNRSSHHTPPVYFKAGKSGDADAYNAHLTWPYGNFSGELDFDDMSPNLSRASSASSTNKGAAFSRSSLRETDSFGASCDGKLSLRPGALPGAHARTQSGSLKNGASNSSLPESGRPLSCPRRSRNGHSDSSGDSAGSDKGNKENSALRTSPMPVPVPRGQPIPRQRQESVSSVGSWQIISGTGSLRGSTGSANAGSANSRCSYSSMTTDMIDSATTIKEEEGSLESEQSIIIFNRAERLAKVCLDIWKASEKLIDRQVCKNHFVAQVLSAVVWKRLDYLQCVLPERLQPEVAGHVFLGNSCSCVTNNIGIACTDVCVTSLDNLAISASKSMNQSFFSFLNHPSLGSTNNEETMQVRSLFYTIYVSSIGLNFSNGRNDSGLGTLVSNFAQKVGIRPMSSK